MTWPISWCAVWWLSADPDGGIHPALAAMLRREGLATGTTRPELTVKGRAVVDRMRWAHIHHGAPLPPPHRGRRAGMTPPPPEVPGRRAGRTPHTVDPDPAHVFFHLGLGLALLLVLAAAALF